MEFQHSSLYPVPKGTGYKARFDKPRSCQAFPIYTLTLKKVMKMDINEPSRIIQNNFLTITNKNETPNTSSHLQSAISYATFLPKKLIDLADRTIGYFSNELIPVAELNALCEQQDQASAAQQIATILSQYSYHRCKSWIYSPLPGLQQTPIELAFDKHKADGNFTIVKAIAHTLEKQYKAYENNATPLGWIELQNPNNNPNISGCCISCKIFNIINSVYSDSDDADLKDLLYCYENYPHVINYSSCSADVSTFMLKAIWSGKLTQVKNMLRFLTNNPYDPTCKTSEPKIRSSYQKLITSITEIRNKGAINQLYGLLNVSVHTSKNELTAKLNCTDATVNYQITEELMKFLYEDNLVMTEKPNLHSLIATENLASFKKMLATDNASIQYPYGKKALDDSGIV